jgi:predicted RNA-binding Zn-ribbon protein involved in translation (DUF1610 family)
MTKAKRTKILLHACPRCHGDLFPDESEDDFACLQCGRRITAEQLSGVLTEARPELVAA